MNLADADRDGKLTPEEAVAAASRLVREADTAKAGSIDAKGLADLIGSRLGPPGGGPFGPPGGGGRDGGPDRGREGGAR